MTKQARQLIEDCDFYDADIELVEKLLCKHTAKQIAQLVWSRDKEGVHSLDWFLPFFNGYIPETMDISIIFDDNFWSAYHIISDFVDDFDISLMPLIGEMSEDTSLVEEAILKSKPHIKYVYKVWQGLQDGPVQTFEMANNDDVLHIKRHEVRTVRLN